jgi:hypothetical protein
MVRQAAVFLFVGFLIGASAISDGRAASLPECIRNSQDADNIINSAPCGLYGIISTRQENGVGNASDVTVQYMVHLPMGAPKRVERATA